MSKVTKILWVRIVFVIAIGLAIFLYLQERFQSISHLPNSEQCIASFDEFAYTFPNRRAPKQSKILPLSPWKAVAVAPELPNSLKKQTRDTLEAVAIRTINNEQEIWFSNLELYDQARVYHVYYPEHQEWSEISSMSLDSSSPVESIHVSNNGSMWGISLTAQKATFSIFNDRTKKFVKWLTLEVPQGLGRYIRAKNSSLLHSDETVWNHKDQLWVFSERDAIYRFDSGNQQVEQIKSLENYDDIHSVVYASTGTIFFSAYHGGTRSTFQYNIATKQILKIPPPNDIIFYSGSLADHAGNLWIRDAYGWWKTDGTWQVLHPHPTSYWWHIDVSAYWRYYSPPDPFLETSDGRIWFRIYSSSDMRNLRTGMAWFHPETREGCWFTSEGAEIVEDSQGNLWMVTDGELYKYEMKP